MSNPHDSDTTVEILEKVLRYCLWGLLYPRGHQADLSPFQKAQRLLSQTWSSQADERGLWLHSQLAGAPAARSEAELALTELLAPWPYNLVDEELVICTLFRAGSFLAGRRLRLDEWAEVKANQPAPASRVATLLLQGSQCWALGTGLFRHGRLMARTSLQQFLLLLPSRPTLLQQMRKDYQEFYLQPWVDLLVGEQFIEAPSAADRDEVIDIGFRIALATFARWLTDHTNGYQETKRFIDGTAAVLAAVVTGNVLRAQAAAQETVVASNLASLGDLLRVPGLPFPLDRAQNVGHALGGAPWPGAGGPLQSIVNLFGGNWDRLFGRGL